MSELKVIDVDKMADVRSLSGQFYRKSEADEVIAEKDVEIAKLKDKCQMRDFFWEGCGFAKRGFKNTIAVSEAFDKLEEELDKNNKELRHNKYKRCLAMASYWLAVSYQCVDDKHRQRAEKHRRKWLEIAEKFKEE